MLQRTSVVDHIDVKIVSYSSILQIGDSAIINALSRAIAVQREAEIFYGDEGDFSAFPIFSETIPFQPIYEPIFTKTLHSPPLIKVKNIHIIGISASSILHVGNSQNVSMEARVEHIRQLLPTGHEQDIR